MVKKSMRARAGLLTLVAGAWLAGCAADEPGRPNVLLVTLDTTRVDHLGCYGYERPTSPVIDRLAADAVVYTHAGATASATLDSHASLFTGKFTTSHGASLHPEGQLALSDAIGPQWELFRARVLSPEERTLAKILSDAGYQTAAVVAGPWLKKLFGWSPGFDSYDDADITVLNGRVAESVTTSAARWLEQRDRSRPFFLFLNYFDPHGPYAAPEEFVRMFLPEGRPLRKLDPSETVALYDAEIRYMDHHFGRLLDRIRELDLYGKTWIIVTADHGELLGEHGLFGHGKHLYQEITHVPLIMKYPRGERRSARNEQPLQLVDLLPLICEELGLEPPEGIQGNVPPDLKHPIVAESYVIPQADTGHWITLHEDRFKLHWSSRGNHMLFDMESDPTESENLAGRRLERAEGMATRLRQYLASLPPPPPPGPTGEVDPETRETLRSLGYIE
jgi:arylsulfatase